MPLYRPGSPQSKGILSGDQAKILGVAAQLGSQMLPYTVEDAEERFDMVQRENGYASHHVACSDGAVDHLLRRLPVLLHQGADDHRCSDYGSSWSLLSQVAQSCICARLGM